MKLIIISGPTATGKTDLGIRLAHKFNGEIISADSRQIYRGMDIITGKDLDENSEFRIQNSELGINNGKLKAGYRLKDGVPVWLVDVAEPDYHFNVGEYSRLAKEVIADIHRRGKLPIVAGGTGLYIKSIVDPLYLLSIPPDQRLRKELEGCNKELLQNHLRKLDPDRLLMMNDSDGNNPRRLMRAIEIALYKKENPELEGHNGEYEYKILWLGLKVSNEDLYKRIDLRVEKRINTGAIEEVRKLLKSGYDEKLPSLSATGFWAIRQYIENKITLEEASKIWKYQEHGYGRRQKTWFNKEKRINWFDMNNPLFMDKIEEEAKKWYNLDVDN